MNEAAQRPRKGTGRTLLLACGALAREVIEFVERNGWDCFTVECLPARLHWQPALIAPAVRDKIRAARHRFDRIYVLYGDCGTAGELDRVLAAEGVERIPGPHCFSFFAGNADHAREAADEGATTFWLTDFFVRHFDRFVWEGLGIDRHPELRELYFGNYEKAVYLAQTDDPALRARAEECARRLGLEYEHRFVGYGDFGRHIAIVADAAPPGAATPRLRQPTGSGTADE
ncbi:MAG: DUF1638 domain-containing protein [Halofilum sp. (in: g-proteobacteria)]|nr:DUF1638 domain-containing protein [Halofilum sp. (in: g-proteobacteria)]